jgi:hypothetical protein
MTERPLKKRYRIPPARGLGVSLQLYFPPPLLEERGTGGEVEKR